MGLGVSALQLSHPGSVGLPIGRSDWQRVIKGSRGRVAPPLSTRDSVLTRRLTAPFLTPFGYTHSLEGISFSCFPIHRFQRCMKVNGGQRE